MSTNVGFVVDTCKNPGSLSIALLRQLNILPAYANRPTEFPKVQDGQIVVGEYHEGYGRTDGKRGRLIPCATLEEMCQLYDYAFGALGTVTWYIAHRQLLSDAFSVETVSAPAAGNVKFGWARAVKQFDYRSTVTLGFDVSVSYMQAAQSIVVSVTVEGDVRPLLQRTFATPVDIANSVSINLDLLKAYSVFADMSLSIDRVVERLIIAINTEEVACQRPPLLKSKKLSWWRHLVGWVKNL